MKNWDIAIETDLIDAAVAFANLENIQNTQQVERLFLGVALLRSHWKTIPNHKDVKGFENDREELRRWLGKISAHGGVTLHEEKVISKRISDTVKVLAQPSFTGERLIVHFAWDFSGVQAAYSTALALLLDKHRKLADGLGKCGLKECDKFFFSRPGVGQPRQYCCDKHRDRDRKRRFRKRKSKNKAKQGQDSD